MNVSGANVCFIGTGNSGQEGVYVKAPGDPCQRIADLNTAIPGGTGNFTSFIPLDGSTPPRQGRRPLEIAASAHPFHGMARCAEIHTMGLDLTPGPFWDHFERLTKGWKSRLVLRPTGCFLHADHVDK